MCVVVVVQLQDIATWSVWHSEYIFGELTAVPASAVPAPTAGAGLPGLIFATGGLLGWWRRARSYSPRRDLAQKFEEAPERPEGFRAAST
jgi:hypothetical protein